MHIYHSYYSVSLFFFISISLYIFFTILCTLSHTLKLLFPSHPLAFLYQTLTCSYFFLFYFNRYFLFMSLSDLKNPILGCCSYNKSRRCKTKENLALTAALLFKGSGFPSLSSFLIHYFICSNCFFVQNTLVFFNLG